MKVYLDFDSTLVTLAEEWIKWLKEEKFIKISTKDILHWNWISDTYGEHVNQFWKTEGIYKNKIKPISGSVEFVNILKKIYGFENVIIISNSARNMVDEKIEFAKKHFNIIPNNFLHVEEKWKYTSDGILIDDAPHNVISHTKNNSKPAILFNYRNRYGWAKLNSPEKYVTICNGYDKCLEVLNSSKRFFSEE